ncbi:probable serine/threonine-protein kinase dyrk1 [Drosophila innubila]|uniref:probable serine/threonine-protein kinase dyrk1 n=1 Tax=Drosophila innubila TaxID=198719 RepID=UPI00148D6109|nr:probable serine/threonine-protein kinase dyrk1 [Drosophila innubila]
MKTQGRKDATDSRTRQALLYFVFHVLSLTPSHCLSCHFDSLTAGSLAVEPKSRHFTVNGLSANNTLQQQQYNLQQQQQQQLQSATDTRNIYNNPYNPQQQQQLQQSQQQQQQQQRTAHLFKALAATAAVGGNNSLNHPYDFSSSSSSSNANNEQQGSSSSEADNAFLTHNNAAIAHAQYRRILIKILIWHVKTRKARETIPFNQQTDRYS